MLLKAAYGVLQITLGVTSEVDVDFLYQLRVDSRDQQTFCAHYMLLKLILINFPRNINLVNPLFSIKYFFFLTTIESFVRVALIGKELLSC